MDYYILSSFTLLPHCPLLCLPPSQDSSLPFFSKNNLYFPFLLMYSISCSFLLFFFFVSPSILNWAFFIYISIVITFPGFQANIPLTPPIPQIDKMDEAKKCRPTGTGCRSVLRDTARIQQKLRRIPSLNH